jgi:hypothetical protein
MLFRIMGEALKRNKQVPILTGTGRKRVVFGVGDTWHGWLSDRRERKLAREVRERLRHHGEIGYYLHVWEHGAWKIVSYFNDI